MVAEMGRFSGDHVSPDLRSFLGIAKRRQPTQLKLEALMGRPSRRDLKMGQLETGGARRLRRRAAALYRVAREVCGETVMLGSVRSSGEISPGLLSEGQGRGADGTPPRNKLQGRRAGLSWIAKSLFLAETVVAFA